MATQSNLSLISVPIFLSENLSLWHLGGWYERASVSCCPSIKFGHVHNFNNKISSFLKKKKKIPRLIFNVLMKIHSLSPSLIVSPVFLQLLIGVKSIKCRGRNQIGFSFFNLVFL